MPHQQSQEKRLWWQNGIVYQIYPRSFQDSNADGIGDLPGIEFRLDHLVSLGVDALWISPFYPSPMADFGYDVADYTGVDPIFGTLDDFDRLIASAHRRGLKLILDFVPNHTSNQHPWFLESRSSRDNPKRDWYLWRDGRDGSYPNNWMSNFGGPGWTWDELTQQFYYHSFLAEQPDLNWHNLEVRAAIYAAMRFWLDKGVDGFRMDVLWLLIKDADFRDNLPNPEWHPGASSFWSVLPTYTADQPETHAIVREMRAVLDAYDQRVLIGEIYLPLPELVRYYGVAENGVLDGAQMPFNFRLIQTDWSADHIAALIHEYEGVLPAGAWPNWVLGNHDQSRLASRIGADQARAAAMLLLTLRGTPTIYYGEEIGMTNGRIPPELVQDPAEKNQPGIGMGRDPERTPMQWDATPNAGFTTGTPWLPINPDFATVNVVQETSDPRSMLALYRKLIELRRLHPALHEGEIHDIRSKRGVLTYTRTHPNSPDRFQIVLNLTHDVQTVNCDEGHIVLTTIMDGAGSPVGGPITIEAGEGLLIALD
jgi:alpha-glucosidase